MSERKPLDQSEFASAKFAFLAGVADDVSLPKIAARLAVKLATKYLHSDTGGVAWPSIKTLCEDLSVSADSAVRKALSSMVARGHLNADHVAGATTRYSIADRYFEAEQSRNKPRTPLQNEAGSNETPPIFEADSPVTFEADTPLQNEADTPPIFEATITGEISPDIDHRILITGKDSPPTPSRRRKPAERDLLADEEARIAEQQFDRFWSSYPRHVGKAEARKAFIKAIADGAGAAEITLGAMRYAAERDREQDPVRRVKYTAHPATWLNKKRWEDEPEPAPTFERYGSHYEPFSGFSSDRSRCGRRLSAFEIAMQGVGSD